MIMEAIAAWQRECPLLIGIGSEKIRLSITPLRIRSRTGTASCLGTSNEGENGSKPFSFIIHMRTKRRSVP